MYDGDHGRVVHVAEIEVLATGDVLELVDEKAVVAVGQKVKQQLQCGQRNETICSESRQFEFSSLGL